LSGDFSSGLSSESSNELCGDENTMPFYWILWEHCFQPDFRPSFRLHKGGSSFS
jgi:hypothetical protein